jgi:hypothetical protein
MTKSFPYLALDSTGRRMILCDHPVPMFGDEATTKKETKMAHVMTNREVQSHTKKLVARLLGQDSAVDDEIVARIKEFLSDKLSEKDHTKVCSMLAGDVEAEDTEPPPNDPDAEPQGKLASDAARADFNRRFPDLARIRIDNFGIQPRKRPASGADVASFNAMFPGLAHIKQA